MVNFNYHRSSLVSGVTFEDILDACEIETVKACSVSYSHFFLLIVCILLTVWKLVLEIPVDASCPKKKNFQKQQMGPAKWKWIFIKMYRNIGQKICMPHKIYVHLHHFLVNKTMLKSTKLLTYVCTNGLAYSWKARKILFHNYVLAANTVFHELWMLVIETILLIVVFKLCSLSTWRNTRKFAFT